MPGPDAAPLWQQLAIVILGPPIMAWLVRLMSRGWALTVQGGTISEKTRKRQKYEFWGLLIFLYIMGIAMFAYAWLT